VTAIKYKEQDENKLSSCEHLGKKGCFKYCEKCGMPIIFKLFELYEVQNVNNWLSWKRVPVRKWWTAFNADTQSRKHGCKEQRKNTQGGMAA
jgi:hypothetical protein